MTSDDMEARMRRREYFHGLRVLPGAWTVVRVDGRSFSRLTELHFDKPFDERMHHAMVEAALALMDELQAVFVFTESDEISVLLERDSTLFDREVEKLVSVSAGVASAAFTAAASSGPMSGPTVGPGIRGHFDGRLWLGTEIGDVVDYFRWRQADAVRCGLNAWAYWTLRKAGKSMAEATAALEGLDVSAKNELLFRNGINFNDVPLWQRRGTGVYREEYEKPGVNPKTGEATSATRRRIKVDEELSTGIEYGEFVCAIAAASLPLLRPEGETDGTPPLVPGPKTDVPT